VPQDPQTRRLVDAVWAAWQALFEYDANAGLATIYAMSEAALRAPARRASRAARLLWRARHLCARCSASVAAWDAYCPSCAAPNYRAWKQDGGRLVPLDPPPHRRKP
jgi:hypothetical protein